ncbi:MAG: hypothetical protein KKD01_12100 [Proteobacteria bacterium]|nr:hypothetical protein [Pseudomonadota bacterium]MBU1137611.1 hypothetical protein [Pseudomonadota bacterium]MBU1234113.1 hypothetical protein [Pseudomonadota bacterium]MBU1418775.1 hypothetical protein [Pseudomonadota bacterium]MBU1455461.1 hypothetical protein [Pseudomonadota bacterium]
MKNPLITFLLLPAFLPGLAAATNLSYTYREITGAESKTFNWELLEKGDQVLITSSGAEEKLVNVCRRDGLTLRWSVTQGSDTDFQAERIANTISLRGRFQGKKIEKYLNIDERPWFQPLSYCLRTLSRGDTKTLSFWTIRMDTLELVAMQAERRGEELIRIEGKKIETRRVEIRKEGFLSVMWSANYWFRTDDNVFVQYRGTHGFPGTPETHVTLSRADSAWTDSNI